MLQLAEANELAEIIEQDGGRAIPVQCDLTQQDKVEKLLDKCAAALGRPTCLVNNASAFLDDEAATLNTEIWDAHMHANLRAPVFLSVAFARQLPVGQNGNIVNIIDQRVLRPTAEYFSYTISKAALWTATQTLAQAFAPRSASTPSAPARSSRASTRATPTSPPRLREPC